MATRNFVGLAVAAATALAPVSALADNTGRESRTSSREGRLRSTMRVDERVSFDLSSGCTYRATVRGTIRPVRGGRDDSERNLVRPDLRISAGVFCPGSTASRMIQLPVQATAIAMPELERQLELRGVVLRENDARRCAYMPDFELSSEGISGRSVAYLCPTGQEGGRGGGPEARGGETEE